MFNPNVDAVHLSKACLIPISAAEITENPPFFHTNLGKSSDIHIYPWFIQGEAVSFGAMASGAALPPAPHGQRLLPHGPGVADWDAGGWTAPRSSEGGIA